MDTEHMNERELATYWGISVTTLQRWRCLQRGPEYIKFGNYIRYPLTAVRAFEANNTVKPRPPRPLVAPDTAPRSPPEEVVLTYEHQEVLNRIRAFLNSPRSDPRVPRVRSHS